MDELQLGQQLHHGPVHRSDGVYKQSLGVRMPGGGLVQRLVNGAEHRLHGQLGHKIRLIGLVTGLRTKNKYLQTNPSRNRIDRIKYNILSFLRQEERRMEKAKLALYILEC